MVWFDAQVAQFKLFCRILYNKVRLRHKWVWKSGVVILLLLLFVRAEVGRQERDNSPRGILLDPWDPLKDPPFIFMKNENAEEEKRGGSEQAPIRNYFQMLKTPTGVCRRLVRFGGGLACRKRSQNSVIMDGDKILCLDPEMKIFESRRTEDCTVLSFGISTDYSFDQGIFDANCQVHMFDTFNFDPKLNVTFMTFHKIGIGPRNLYIYSVRENSTLEFNSLEYILERLNLSSKHINVLKIDIEGEEWKILEELLKGDLLSSVGQIAMEVHDTNKTNSLNTRFVEMSRVLLGLEEAGFRRVVYWDNAISDSIVDEYEVPHKTAGELLLVNFNWYSATHS